MKGDGTKGMRLECLNDMSVLGQVGLEVGNSGDVLALRKRDGDVEKQRIPISAMMMFERMGLFGSHVNTNENLGSRVYLRKFRHRGHHVHGGACTASSSPIDRCCYGNRR
jgi:hypothetical protein